MQGAMLKLILPESVHVAEAEAWMWSTPARTEEEASLGNAAAQRLAEFRAGRHTAHAALAGTGLDESLLLRAENGAPLWPDERTGCITHTGDYCAAAVASRQDFLAIGIDAERQRPLAPHVLQKICTAAELAWLVTHADFPAAGLLFFSAKECVQKICGARQERLPLPLEMEIEMDKEHCCFQARLIGAGRKQLPDCLHGRYIIDAARVYTAIVMPA